MRLLAPLALAILCAACAPRALVAKAPARSAVRGRVEPGQADAVFGRAVQVLGERGYQFTECDDDRSLLRTERAEQDAPCYGMTCLVRQKVTIKVGWRSMSLVVRREVFDSAVRSWVEAYDTTSQRDVEREEHEILRQMVSADLELLARDRLSPLSAGRTQALETCGHGHAGDRAQAARGSRRSNRVDDPADDETSVADLGLVALHVTP